MSKLDVIVVEHKEDITVFGLSRQSNDKTQSKDIPTLSKQYYEAIGKSSGEVSPFFVISSDYDKKSKNFKLFIAGPLEHSCLKPLIIPKGTYAKVTVKPTMGFLWGLSIGKAKRTFYTKWLPRSKYTALNMEFEFHTEKSQTKTPSIDIFFSIK